MRTTLLATAAVLAAFSYAAPAARAQAAGPAVSPAPAASGAAPLAPAKPADPVIARVNGAEIHLSDLQQAAVNLPDQYRQMPQQMLYPMLLDQLVDRRAIADYAVRRHHHEPAPQGEYRRHCAAGTEHCSANRKNNLLHRRPLMTGKNTWQAS